MTITEAQQKVYNRLKEIGYLDIETTPLHAFTHLIEEVGEVARALLHKETKRGDIPYTTEPSDLADEVADILWQTLKLASYLDIDLEKAFENKYQKNLLKKQRIDIKK